MKKVPVFKHAHAIGIVDYIDNLDRWDGRNFNSGRNGRHLGVGRCKKGWYVCYGTQWQGERSYAELVPETEARRICLKHNPDIFFELFGEDLADLM
jgi:hypothetical protein